MRPGTDAWLSACSVVRTALEDNGYFVARYDQISQEFCDSIVFAMEELFSLPVETKAQKTSDKPLHGYLGQFSRLPLFESLGIDDPLTLRGCRKFTHTMWPEGNDRFCDSINEYSKELEKIDHMVKKMVFESYGVDKQRCDSLIESSDYFLRCMKYRAPQMNENDLGMHCHTDLTIISIVHQLNNLNGLEIKMKDGEWKGVDASSSLFVVMAGDALNLRDKPIKERVLVFLAFCAVVQPRAFKVHVTEAHAVQLYTLTAATPFTTTSYSTSPPETPTRGPRVLDMVM
ncbi:hypothetical protein Fmac_029667 [Flemingia macrophylla]|uniref:Isopenicillin N synthase-like Fe(2+) 2OG dioxygenase domain-containing protein n=1 Tax=Flemingia macrophylla TaxID=520843 RepID=A0ABD1LAZ9_9FABA